MTASTLFDLLGKLTNLRDLSILWAPGKPLTPAEASPLQPIFETPHRLDRFVVIWQRLYSQNDPFASLVSSYVGAVESISLGLDIFRPMLGLSVEELALAPRVRSRWTDYWWTPF